LVFSFRYCRCHASTGFTPIIRTLFNCCPCFASAFCASCRLWYKICIQFASLGPGTCLRTTPHFSNSRSTKLVSPGKNLAEIGWKIIKIKYILKTLASNLIYCHSSQTMESSIDVQSIKHTRGTRCLIWSWYFWNKMNKRSKVYASISKHV